MVGNNSTRQLSAAIRYSLRGCRPGAAFPEISPGVPSPPRNESDAVRRGESTGGEDEGMAREATRDAV